MKIHITGGFRCGTTLLRNLMICFEDVWVYHTGAEPYFPEVPQDNADITVTKCGLTRERMGRWLEEDVKILVIVRNPLDMSCSAVYDQPDARFSDIRPDCLEYVAACVPRLENIPNKRLLIRYEDLVRSPGDVQKRIANFFDLDIRYPFSVGYKYFPSVAEAPEQNSLGSSSGGSTRGVINRPIDIKSIDIWKQHPMRRRAEELSQEPYVREFISLYYKEG